MSIRGFRQNKLLLSFSLFLAAGLILSFSVYSQYFGGKFFRKSKNGIVVQGTVTQKPRDSKIYAEVEAYPSGEVRIDFVLLKDSQGNVYQPLSMQKVLKSQLRGNEKDWPPNLPEASLIGKIFAGLFSGSLAFAVADDPVPPVPLAEELGTITLCTYNVPAEAKEPFSVVVGVSTANLPIFSESQVVIDTSLPKKPKLSESECSCCGKGSASGNLEQE